MSMTLRLGLVGSGGQLIAAGELLLQRGHDVVAIVSDCPEVTAWAARHAIRRLPDPSTVDWPEELPLDYLLSIVNHALLSRELLEAPEGGAINYHDSLLPMHGGFNATSWSILDGSPTHGVTWHEMTADADRGPVLLQHSFEIEPDDTAFSLGVKCSEAGVSSFRALLDLHERGVLEPRRQEGAGSFHRRSERPGLAILDFDRPASDLHDMVRGLNMGATDNWMATAKLLSEGGCLAVLEARPEEAPTSAEPGTVLAINDHGILVATADGALRITEVATLDGEAIGCTAAASRLGLAEGRCLAPMDTDARAAADDFDAVVTRSERFWSRQPAVLAALQPVSDAARPSTLRRRLPDVLKPLAQNRRGHTLVAAFAACVHRLSGQDVCDFAASATVPTTLTRFYHTVTPFRSAVTATTTFAELVDLVAAEITERNERGTYARDAVLRYPEDSNVRRRSGERLAIGIALGAEPPAAGGPGRSEASLPEDCRLLLMASDDDEGYAWVYDESAIAGEEVETLSLRVEALLESAVRTPHEPIRGLSVVLPQERELLLDAWQDTRTPFESDLCVHQSFERQVERTPDARALVFGGATLTYRELNERANQVAHGLIGTGVGPETLVAICVERSLEMVIGLLGILKAGGAYVPMDPAYPRARLAIMLADSQAPALLTQGHLADRLPETDATVVLVDRLVADQAHTDNPASGVQSNNLAYVIFTSGSTGRPKGTMLEHRNVSNFFAGMDSTVLGDDAGPGVWLAVTSISFDISVLELLWTLSRGFEVVLAPEGDRASLERSRARSKPHRPMGFGLFYFAADAGTMSGGGAYRLLLEGAKFADTHDFEAVWTPERHFHAFGGLYPNPAVTTAALATITERVHLRAGSVVLPLHNPLRVAEDWAVLDHLSNGRIGLSFASGWHVNDFAFMPDNYERRREIMAEHIDTVMTLWRGEKVSVLNGAGHEIQVSVLPRPLQQRPPIWIAAAGSPATFEMAGRIGANILTNMLGQDLNELKGKFAAYRRARRDHGHDGDGIISVMLHTYVNDDTEEARRLVRDPFSDYLASSFDLVKMAPKMFPAFRQPSKRSVPKDDFDSSAFTPEDMTALLDHAFERYFESAGLFGTPERALEMVDRLSEIGATEIACLVDFGIDPEVVLESLPHLNRLREMCVARVSNDIPVRATEEDESIAALMTRHAVTHFQCTPSMARVLADDPESLAAMAGLRRLLVGGEALPAELADQLASTVSGSVMNMYGPTETTVWSTTSAVVPGQAPTIGRPVANTTIRIVDEHGQLAPIGTSGEVLIGGEGVARGYLNRPDLTGARFVPDPWNNGARLYRTGDLARYGQDGDIEFLGRIDHQVKVNGYRIELGEIETALERHRGVHQSVVVAQRPGTEKGVATLAAYVVPARGGSERVGEWRDIWEETYRESLARNGADGRSPEGDPRFRLSGWNDSYSGEPISEDEMSEWLYHTVSRVESLAPTRVLEIGCGTGLILYRLVNGVDHYTGTDISSTALESIRQELTPDESVKVELLQRAAHELEDFSGAPFDLVVINSVAQYFPDAEYLMDVIGRAARLVSDGGHIFVGDVRSLAHQGAFHTSLALHDTPDTTPVSDLTRAVERGLTEESELVLGEEFFHALVRDTPRLSCADVSLKRGRSHNELTRFRYDVVLHVGESESQAQLPLPAPAHVSTLAAVRDLLAASPTVVHLAGVPNARLSGIAAAARVLNGDATAAPDAGGLSSVLRANEGVGVDPDDLYDIDARYDVDVRWASDGDVATFDAVLRAKGQPRPRFELPSHGEPAPAYANTPAARGDTAALANELRTHLQSLLPEYMIPAVFVTLDRIPLTPNGKIDRNALPDPIRRATRRDTPYAPPRGTLEQQIGQIWKELLGLDQVGRQDNIFDLGANSLLTMQANTRLSSALDRKVPLVSMFRFPTVASLAAHLDEAASAAEDAAAKQRDSQRSSRMTAAAERRRALRAAREGR